ncbi:hypothetical protein [Pseudoxanthomonas mexicana]|uniref:hypothetical protein n=1 Tax=Pseudoxanthomonas mexicana TaxID=128785 RepID=UPI00398AE654
MNRQQWQADYRRNRATVRLIDAFRRKTGREIDVYGGVSNEFWERCFYAHDRLNYPSVVGKSWSDLKLRHLRERVRLPA